MNLTEHQSTAPGLWFAQDLTGHLSARDLTSHLSAQDLTGHRFAQATARRPAPPVHPGGRTVLFKVRGTPARTGRPRAARRP